MSISFHLPITPFSIAIGNNAITFPANVLLSTAPSYRSYSLETITFNAIIPIDDILELQIITYDVATSTPIYSTSFIPSPGPFNVTIISPTSNFVEPGSTLFLASVSIYSLASSVIYYSVDTTFKMTPQSLTT